MARLRDSSGSSGQAIPAQNEASAALDRAGSATPKSISDVENQGSPDAADFSFPFKWMNTLEDGSEKSESLSAIWAFTRREEHQQIIALE